VQEIGKAIHRERRVMNLPPWFGYLVSRIIGFLVHDVFITREEIRGLMNGLLDGKGPATGTIRLSDWCRENASRIGRGYTSELARRNDRTIPYISDPLRR
jgi:NADH dehydrogenase